MREDTNINKWLLNNGLMNDITKDQLYLFGAILHPGIEAIELQVDVVNKRIGYEIFVNKKLEAALKLYGRLSESTSIIGLWRFKRLIKREGDLQLYKFLEAMVHDYCGAAWKVDMYIKPIKEYKDGIEQDINNTGNNKQHYVR